jgi:hypothetical protein
MADASGGGAAGGSAAGAAGAGGMEKRLQAILNDDAERIVGNAFCVGCAALHGGAAGVRSVVLTSARARARVFVCVCVSFVCVRRGARARVQAMTEFCASEHCDENIRFWTAVRAFKRESEPTLQIGLAREIVATFIADSAPVQINADARTRARYTAAIAANEAAPNVFEKLERIAFRELMIETLPRYLRHLDKMRRRHSSLPLSHAVSSPRLLSGATRRMSLMSDGPSEGGGGGSGSLPAPPARSVSGGASFRGKLPGGPAAAPAAAAPAGAGGGASRGGGGSGAAALDVPIEGELARALRLRKKSTVLGLHVRPIFSARERAEHVEVAARLRSQAHKLGYLHKRGDGFQSWKRRWFVLTRDTLAYFESASGVDPPRGVVLLIEVRAVNEVPEADVGMRYVFTLVTNRRTYYVQANSPRDLERWLRALRLLVREPA